MMRGWMARRCMATWSSAEVQRVSSRAREVIQKELKYNARNYRPLEVVIARGRGAVVYDVDEKMYLDFLSSYSAVNQGHCHPEIIKVMKEQADILTLTSRAFYHDKLGDFAEFMSTVFGYEKMLPANTGVEGGETACKLARRWAYDVKGVPDNQARILFAKGNFWGRTLAAVSSSTDPSAYSRFGPFMPMFDTVEYNNIGALKQYLEKHGASTAAFMVEPIQGEAGIVVPDEGYLGNVHELCKQHNVLLIADEVQSGMGRAGKLLASYYDGVRPDIVVLGKALSGGVLPVSAVIADSFVIDTIRPGEHGSTFGGNPLSCVVARRAVEVLLEEGMIENSARQGERLHAGLNTIKERFPFIKTIRGKGLMNAIVCDEEAGDIAVHLCYLLRDRGLITKYTHGHIIRLSPPLCITDKQIDDALDIMESGFSAI